MNHKITSWNDRFALIDAFKPGTAAICKKFNIKPQELNTAVALRNAGTFSPTLNLDMSKFDNFFPDELNFDDEQILTIQRSDAAINKIRTVVNPVGEHATVHAMPETATKRTAVKEPPQKRGRKGNKIVEALKAVTNEPVPVEAFALAHDVSVAVLRQAKRFTEGLSSTEIEQIGTVIVKQDKATKTLMIWRQDNKEE